MTEEVDRRPGDERDELGSREVVERVGDDDLVADGGDDDPGDDDDVEIGVPVPGQPRALAREREPPLSDRGNEVEVEPPEGRGGEERETERGEARGVERSARRSSRP